MVKEETSVAETAAENPKIFVTGLPNEISKSSMITVFNKYGKVTDAVFKCGSDGTRVKGQAFVYFESQEAVDKLLEQKSVMIENRKVHVKKPFEDGEQEGDEPKTDIPLAALKCIVCKKDQFYHVRSYLNHRKGKQHQAVFSCYRAKRMSVRNLLRAEAKLAADRQYDKEWMRAHPDFNVKCEVCQCQIFCKLQKHEASIEHKMVRNFDVQKCCDIVFNNEWKKYENHLLSLNHLKNVYDKEQSKDENEAGGLTMKRAIDVFKQCDADLKEMKETYGDLDLNAELPPFDPTKPIGLNYIVKKINYHCVCCDQKFFPNINLVEPHCRSYNHFTNMQDYVLSLEKKQALKNKKAAAPDKTPSEPAEKRKNEEEHKVSKRKIVITTKDPVVKKVVKTGKLQKENDKSEKPKSGEGKKEIKADDQETETEEKSGDHEDDNMQDEDEEHLQGVEEEDDFDQAEEENIQDEEEEEYYQQEGDEDQTLEEVEDDQALEEEVADEDEVHEEEVADEDEVHEEDQGEDEVHEEDQGEDEVHEEEQDESMQEVEEGSDNQVLVTEDDVQDNEDDEIVALEKEEKQVEVIDVDMSETPEEEATNEEEPVEIVEPKRRQTATRGRRGRGRGRALKR